MINATLSYAATYVRTSRAPRAFLSFLARVRRIITFTHERANRLVRFIAIVRAYKAGQMVRDIESKYGCSRSTVLRYARLAGEPKRPKTEDPERRARIIALAKKGGLSQKQIAERCKCSVALVSIVEHEAGLARYGR